RLAEDPEAAPRRGRQAREHARAPPHEVDDRRDVADDLLDAVDRLDLLFVRPDDLAHHLLDLPEGGPLELLANLLDLLEARVYLVGDLLRDEALQLLLNAGRERVPEPVDDPADQ